MTTKKYKNRDLHGAPASMPALLAAKIIQERAAKLGFDWNSHNGPISKIAEELKELESAVKSGKAFEELGDLLFACVNLARHLNIEPEDALCYANRKFIKRFRKLKTALARAGKDIKDSTLEEMDKIWDEIKE